MTIAGLQERAEAHQTYLNRNTKFLTVTDLKDRWGCSPNTVRAVPFADLPYINIGTGLVRESRRYDPDDVAAYELKKRLQAR